ncbi:hypothetical protein J6590_105228, partial [Homalodisca vitripennis]
MSKRCQVRFERLLRRLFSTSSDELGSAFQQSVECRISHYAAHSEVYGLRERSEPEAGNAWSGAEVQGDVTLVLAAGLIQADITALKLTGHRSPVTLSDRCNSSAD